MRHHGHEFVTQPGTGAICVVWGSPAGLPALAGFSSASTWRQVRRCRYIRGKYIHFGLDRLHIERLRKKSTAPLSYP
jgi:hypothetical protein